VQHISSRQNPIVARYRAARERKREDDPVLLDGVHLVADAVAAGAPLRDVVVAAAALARPDVKPLLNRLAAARVKVATASPAVMAALSPVRSPSPIVALTDTPDAGEARAFKSSSPLIVIAYCVQDPGNLGAIIRVAEAAGASGVMGVAASANPFGWKAVRASMGSALRLPVIHNSRVDVVLAARRRGCRIFATVPRDGRSVFDVDLKGPTAILIGGEGGGLPPGLMNDADERITIPMQTPVESLNAAVTTAVILYEARRQRTIADCGLRIAD
jgi:TrmH family RNA methyltransferase